jgi:hypothetical protein
MLNFKAIGKLGVTPIITTLGMLRQENHEFEASLGYTERPHFQKKAIQD